VAGVRCSARLGIPWRLREQAIDLLPIDDLEEPRYHSNAVGEQRHVPKNDPDEQPGDEQGERRRKSVIAQGDEAHGEGRQRQEGR